MKDLQLRLTKIQRTKSPHTADERTARMEFHVSRKAREEHDFDKALFALRGNVILTDFKAVREFAQRLNSRVNPIVHPERFVKAGQLNAMGMIDEILHYVAALFREQVAPNAFDKLLDRLQRQFGAEKVDKLLKAFTEQFPPQSVFSGKLSVEEYLAGSDGGENNRAIALEELMLLRLANENQAFEPFKHLFDDTELSSSTIYDEAFVHIINHFAQLPPFGPDNQNLWEMLRSPAVAEPHSLGGQLDYIRKRWGLMIGKYLLRLLTGIDVMKEEEKPVFSGPGPTRAYVYDEMQHEYERFSPDKDWMPSTVLIAKSTLVWLFQLSKKYNRPIDRLDLIPDEELDELACRGFTGLWLIGLWERSNASREIKQRCGNPEAAASAYSLYDYDIAHELGGWAALDNLRGRCSWRGIKLGSDMVPNHTGIDSRWMIEHPDRFLQLRHPPFPTYTFNGGNLSHHPGIGIYIEDHYYDRSDAAVVFKRVDFSTGDTRYIYHGNDGTSMPWNDTAQIDFLNPEAREAVISTIVGVCHQFPIVRFDAAMTLAKKHIQRLWYPEPGRGGDIASRSEQAISREEFERRIPNEFWREVVDRCAREAPDTLLLAEAFWMMEGYFVRTLGMHRVYNSAFMNMLKMEENAKYRATIKNTLEFDPEILKRFVNFMNNPDEDTAVAQFGKGDKYFGICTLMATMPGLPMFGHGQIEALEEKYGMEYRRAYKDESPDADVIGRHEREIFPLLKKRRLFSGSNSFALYDLNTVEHSVNENVFAYSNCWGNERALVLYNNSYHQSSGWVYRSAPALQKQANGEKTVVTKTLSEALGLSGHEEHFTLFREQRSELWFIRPSKEIAERGLFVALGGYQSQIFLDLHEVSDNEHHRWRRLCDELAGSGVPDLFIAFQDLFLRDLYTHFRNLVNPEMLSEFQKILLSSNKASAKRLIAFIETLEEPALRFIQIATEYLDGAAGRWDSFECSTAYTPIDEKAIWESFAFGLKIFHLALQSGKKPPLTMRAPSSTCLRQLHSDIVSDPDMCIFVTGYLTMNLLRGIIGEGATGEDACRLVEHWGLARKLSESFTACSISPEKASHIMELLSLILSVTASGSQKSNHAQNPLLFAQQIFTRDDFRAFFGVNIFDDIAWFKKEPLEEAISYGRAISLVENQDCFGSTKALNKKARNETSAWLSRLEQIAIYADTYRLAEKASDYQVENFLKALAPLPAGKRKSPGKQPPETLKKSTSSRK